MANLAGIKMGNLKREINVGSVRVHGNCMECGNTAIQLSNISSLSTSKVKGNPLVELVVVFVGIMSLSIHWLLGLAFILTGALIFYVKIKNKKYILSISTNSGGNFSVVFGSDLFLKHVYDVLTEIIANPEKESDTTINISSQKIEMKEVEFKDYATLQNFEGTHG